MRARSRIPAGGRLRRTSLSRRVFPPAAAGICLALCLCAAVRAEVGVLSSQVGYDARYSKHAVIRSDRPDFLDTSSRFEIAAPDGAIVSGGRVRYWGAMWKAHWWIADFSDLRREGTYRMRVISGGRTVASSDAFEIRDEALWRACYPVMAIDFLEERARQARTGLGWRDCGSDLQEFSSHVVALDGVCDVLEIARGRISAAQRSRLLAQLLVGGAYLAHLQDKARKLGLGDGAVIHEDRQDHVVTGNVAKAAMIFARLSRLLRASKPETSAEYLKRAAKAFAWIEKNGPVVNDEKPLFFPSVHGAPAGSRPPRDQWMTRDLVMMLRACVELFKAGRPEYKEKAVRNARRLERRQVPREESEGGLYGHFYLYDDFTALGGVRITEKANIHCGAWSKDGRIYNKGGHYPHYLLPLIDMLAIWPDHPGAPRWRRLLRDFAYGYFVPVSKRSPFGILPAGYFRGEGLLFFSGWYHAHNNIYAFAATLALEFEKLFGDRRFRDIAVANLQWVAGVNAGILEAAGKGPLRRYVPVSMIHGIGQRFRGSWTRIPGSICNGFAAHPQFSMHPPRAEDDLPLHFHTEAYIAHSLPYLAALARFVVYPDPAGPPARR